MAVGGADVRPNSIWPGSIFTVVLLFAPPTPSPFTLSTTTIRMCEIFMAHKEGKKNKTETHVNQSLQWSSDSVNSAFMGNWVDWVYGRLEEQYFHLWTRVGTRVSQWITSSDWGCFYYVDIRVQTKRSSNWTGPLWKKIKIKHWYLFLNRVTWAQTNSVKKGVLFFFHFWIEFRNDHYNVKHQVLQYILIYIALLFIFHFPKHVCVIFFFLSSGF